MPPLVVTTGGRRVEITSEKSRDEPYVSRMVVDDVVVLPPTCNTNPPLPSLCTDEYRNQGHGGEFLVRLVDWHAEDTRAEFVFASAYDLGPECGAYGFWMIRVDAIALLATPPIQGCFYGHVDVSWSDPTQLTLTSQGGAPLVYRLDPSKFLFRPK
jgi:hypothetical protein